MKSGKTLTIAACAVFFFEYESMAPSRVTTRLLGVFAALALLISSGGIAAVMTVSVTQRTREIGIRMALGAERRAVVAMVIREGLTLAVIGTAAGILCSTSLYASPIYFALRNEPDRRTDVLGVSLLFLTVGATACCVPARQVTAIDPLIALREE